MRSKPQELGRIGELLVCRTFGGELSRDPTDEDKDLIDEDGRTVEVKTQCPHPTTGVFSAPAKQERKCTEVDRLIIVEFNETDWITIREVIDRKDFSRYRTNPSRFSQIGVAMIGWDRKNTVVIRKIRDGGLSSRMRELSGDWRFRKAG